MTSFTKQCRHSPSSTGSAVTDLLFGCAASSGLLFAGYSAIKCWGSDNKDHAYVLLDADVSSMSMSSEVGQHKLRILDTDHKLAIVMEAFTGQLDVNTVGFSAATNYETKIFDIRMFKSSVGEVKSPPGETTPERKNAKPATRRERSSAAKAKSSVEAEVSPQRIIEFPPSYTVVGENNILGLSEEDNYGTYCAVWMKTRNVLLTGGSNGVVFDPKIGKVVQEESLTFQASVCAMALSPE
ncbi:uncharacterized protein BJ171DRAFT_474381 [Polychytrium aggregatum]|uniref:uncharacterized protein n=1 Tax=Polychytrium aggregatum TaxID=110093 RepID=UPI0022FDC7A5|nr:uncharacterized protein BJ171DRAFT_474381 [Polychytrium aggregatum]KAI9205448.1 hypothetical protein BJ171DRAFT_474381 [Polychytrium aggregatum]